MLSPSIVDFLLAHGADPTIRDDGGSCRQPQKFELACGRSQTFAENSLMLQLPHFQQREFYQ